jgi:secreted trypsin-like serine protease
MTRGFTVLTVLLAAAGPAAADGVGSIERPIIGGTYKPGDDAVVALTIGPDMSRDNIICTGTLVSPHVVVAAGHCVAFGETPSHVYFGSDPLAGGTWVAVASVAAHPEFDVSSLANDISVLVLAEAAPAGVKPYPMASVAPAVGMNARFVGFGCRDIGGQCGPYGEKYETNAPITQVNATDFKYGVATCNGDSGGPAFVMEGDREVLAGVTSWGDGPCAEFGYDTRVDAYAAWVQTTVDMIDPNWDVEPEEPGDDGGCGCRAGGAGGGAGGRGLLVAGLLAAVIAGWWPKRRHRR